MDEATFDRKTIVVAGLAILGFVVVGALVAVFGAPEESTSVLTSRETPTSSVGADEPDFGESATTGSTIADEIEIVFEPVFGLGFELRRVWTYDVTTNTLENVVEIRPDRPDLLVAYTEVLPPSMVDLGDYEFEPLTDDVVTLDNGTKEYGFALEATDDDPGELRWIVVTDRTLNAVELDQLAAARNAAEAASVGG